jgi:hypothetical protein
MNLPIRWQMTIYACSRCGVYWFTTTEAASCCPGAGALRHDVVHASELEKLERG